MSELGAGDDKMAESQASCSHNQPTASSSKKTWNCSKLHGAIGTILFEVPAEAKNFENILEESEKVKKDWQDTKSKFAYTSGNGQVSQKIAKGANNFMARDHSEVESGEDFNPVMCPEVFISKVPQIFDPAKVETVISQRVS